MEIKIRKAQSNDLQHILVIWEEFMAYLDQINPDYWPIKNGATAFENYLNSNLNNPKALIAVAEKNNRILGFSLAYIEHLPEWFGQENIGLIRYLALSKNSQSQGIGTRIVDFMMNWFRDHKIKRVELYVLKGLPASHFWAKHGFVEFMDRRFLEIE